MSGKWGILADRYERISHLGKGGNGTVFLAKDRHLDCFVAVKEADKAHPEAVEALFRERQVLKGLCHPGIPKVLDFLEEEDTFFLVTEWAEGKSMEELCGEQEEGQPDLIQIQTWFLTVCRILEYLETRNPPLIHGDLKPEHLIADGEGGVMLIDFGSAFELGTEPSGQGTQGFAPPEFYPEEEGKPEISSDLYSLGASLRRILAGRKIPGIWTYIIWKCMRKKPGKRWKNAGSLRRFWSAGRYFHTRKV